MAKKKDANVIDLPVSFGGVSFGKKTARVGVNVEREHLKLPVADKTLCDRRLAVTIFANANGDQQGQGRLAGMDESLELTGSADVKGFGVHSTSIAFGLTFNKVELKKLGVAFDEFAGREGRVTIAEVADIPEEEKNAQDDGDGE